MLIEFFRFEVTIKILMNFHRIFKINFDAAFTVIEI